jgi:hypothetical protein
MKTVKVDRAAILRGRGIVLFVAGALAFGLGVSGISTSIAGGSSQLRTRPDPTVTFTPAEPVASAAVTHPVRPATPARPSPTASPTLDPTALADGIYPTYVRAVDVRGATVTVDVLQTFFGDAAHRAAIQDGVPWSDVQFEPVYIRNDNPLLRTLPVARDVRIKLIGVCMDPGRRIALRELRKATTPFTGTFYYEVTVVGGSVERIQQLIAVAGC